MINIKLFVCLLTIMLFASDIQSCESTQSEGYIAFEQPMDCLDFCCFIPACIIELVMRIKQYKKYAGEVHENEALKNKYLESLFIASSKEHVKIQSISSYEECEYIERRSSPTNLIPFAMLDEEGNAIKKCCSSIQIADV